MPNVNEPNSGFFNSIPIPQNNYNLNNYHNYPPQFPPFNPPIFNQTINNINGSNVNSNIGNSSFYPFSPQINQQQNNFNNTENSLFNNINNNENMNKNFNDSVDKSDLIKQQKKPTGISRSGFRVASINTQKSKFENLNSINRDETDWL